MWPSFYYRKKDSEPIKGDAASAKGSQPGPEYAVKIAGSPFVTFEREYMDLAHRYTRMHIPTEFSRSLSWWTKVLLSSCKLLQSNKTSADRVLVHLGYLFADPPCQSPSLTLIAFCAFTLGVARRKSVIGYVSLALLPPWSNEPFSLVLQFRLPCLHIMLPQAVLTVKDSHFSILKPLDTSGSL